MPRPDWVCVAALFLPAIVACGGSDRAPFAPPPDPDAAIEEPDTGPPQPIDCMNSIGMQDADGDGFPRSRGDCDDCDKAIGPAAFEVPGNGIDEDCDGKDPLEPAPACDAPLKPASAKAEDAAKAFGLCAQHSSNSRLPGLIEANWQRLSGADETLIDTRQVWFPQKFGTIAAREGGRLVVMSTGVARDVNDDEYTKDCDAFNSVFSPTTGWSESDTPPVPYPIDSSKCPKGTNSIGTPAYNEVILSLTVRVPTNVKSLAFDSMFFTYEYPDFVCSEFNDFFVVLVSPAPKELQKKYVVNEEGNVLFDSNDDTIGVNTGLLSVCRAAERGRVARSIACEKGPGLLAQTGFDQGESRCAAKQSTKTDIGGASTGWLHTNVPVPAGKIVTLRFVLWDSGDPLLDSTVLLDNFRWSPDEAPVGTGPITGG